MAKNTTPPPSADFESQLMDCVIRRDVQAARTLFDGALWRNQQVEAKWSHLREALLRKDKPMMRLLVTHRAVPTIEEINNLRAENGDAFQDNLLLLFRAGLRQYMLANMPHLVNPLAPMPDVAPILNAKTDLKDKIPGEWKHVLQCFHSAGATEAIIAGGALRDLDNGRPVRDVDIFLSSRLTRGAGFVEKVIQAAGLDIVPTDHSIDAGGSAEGLVSPLHWSQKTKKTAFRGRTGVYNLREDSKATSWTIHTPHNTYNIVIIGGGLARSLRSGYVKTLLESFDFGICEIAYDGKDILKTRQYTADKNDRKLSLNRGAHTNVNHFERLQEKYSAPEWRLCNAAKEVFENPDLKLIEKIPDQWKRVLAGFHKASAKSAFIAGGALRDLAHDKPVRDVDIFMNDAGIFNESRIKTAFEKAGLEIVNTEENNSDYAPLPWKKSKKTGKLITEGAYSSSHTSLTSSWIVKARDPNSDTPHHVTEYNVISVSGIVGDAMRMKKPFLLLDTFDIGICQIAFNGRYITKTGTYESDTKEKLIHIVKENTGTPAHLRRIREKYGDWNLCDRSVKLLPPPPKPAQAAQKPAPKPKSSSYDSSSVHGGWSDYS